MEKEDLISHSGQAIETSIRWIQQLTGLNLRIKVAEPNYASMAPTQTTQTFGNPLLVYTMKQYFVSAVVQI